MAQTLGLQDKAGQAPLEGLKDTLRDAQMLLLLDNFEPQRVSNCCLLRPYGHGWSIGWHC
jgi:hypothetical protein